MLERAFDIIAGNLQSDRHEELVERLNLNVPKDVREGLKRLARREGRREAEVARDLLVHAVEDAEREEFARSMEESQTPELRARLRRVANALEKLRGEPR